MKKASFVFGLLAIVTGAISVKAGLFGFFSAKETLVGVILSLIFIMLFLLVEKRREKAN